MSKKFGSTSRKLGNTQNHRNLKESYLPTPPGRLPSGKGEKKTKSGSSLTSLLVDESSSQSQTEQELYKNATSKVAWEQQKPPSKVPQRSFYRESDFPSLGLAKSNLSTSNTDNYNSHEPNDTQKSSSWFRNIHQNNQMYPRRNYMSNTSASSLRGAQRNIYNDQRPSLFNSGNNNNNNSNNKNGSVGPPRSLFNGRLKISSVLSEKSTLNSVKSEQILKSLENDDWAAGDEEDPKQNTMDDKSLKTTADPTLALSTTAVKTIKNQETENNNNNNNNKNAYNTSNKQNLFSKNSFRNHEKISTGTAPSSKPELFEIANMRELMQQKAEERKEAKLREQKEQEEAMQRKINEKLDELNRKKVVLSPPNKESKIDLPIKIVVNKERQRQSTVESATISSESLSQTDRTHSNGRKVNSASDDDNDNDNDNTNNDNKKNENINGNNKNNNDNNNNNKNNSGKKDDSIINSTADSSDNNNNDNNILGYNRINNKDSRIPMFNKSSEPDLKEEEKEEDWKKEKLEILNSKQHRQKVLKKRNLEGFPDQASKSYKKTDKYYKSKGVVGLKDVSINKTATNTADFSLEKKDSEVYTGKSEKKVEASKKILSENEAVRSGADISIKNEDLNSVKKLEDGKKSSESKKVSEDFPHLKKQRQQREQKTWANASSTKNNVSLRKITEGEGLVRSATENQKEDISDEKIPYKNESTTDGSKVGKDNSTNMSVSQKNRDDFKNNHQWPKNLDRDGKGEIRGSIKRFCATDPLDKTEHKKDYDNFNNQRCEGSGDARKTPLVSEEKQGEVDSIPNSSQKGKNGKYNFENKKLQEKFAKNKKYSSTYKKQNHVALSSTSSENLSVKDNEMQKVSKNMRHQKPQAFENLNNIKSEIVFSDRDEKDKVKLAGGDLSVSEENKVVSLGSEARIKEKECVVLDDTSNSVGSKFSSSKTGEIQKNQGPKVRSVKDGEAESKDGEVSNNNNNNSNIQNRQNNTLSKIQSLKRNQVPSKTSGVISDRSSIDSNGLVHKFVYKPKIETGVASQNTYSVNSAESKLDSQTKVSKSEVPNNDNEKVISRTKKSKNTQENTESSSGVNSNSESGQLSNPKSHLSTNEHSNLNPNFRAKGQKEKQFKNYKYSEKTMSDSQGVNQIKNIIAVFQEKAKPKTQSKYTQNAFEILVESDPSQTKSTNSDSMTDNDNNNNNNNTAKETQILQSKETTEETKSLIGSEKIYTTKKALSKRVGQKYKRNYNRPRMSGSSIQKDEFTRQKSYDKFVSKEKSNNNNYSGVKLSKEELDTKLGDSKELKRNTKENAVQPVKKSNFEGEKMAESDNSVQDNNNNNNVYASNPNLSSVNNTRKIFNNSENKNKIRNKTMIRGVNPSIHKSDSEDWRKKQNRMVASTRESNEQQKQVDNIEAPKNEKHFVKENNNSNKEIVRDKSESEKEKGSRNVLNNKITEEKDKANNDCPENKNIEKDDNEINNKMAMNEEVSVPLKSKTVFPIADSVGPHFAQKRYEAKYGRYNQPRKEAPIYQAKKNKDSTESNMKTAANSKEEALVESHKKDNIESKTKSANTNDAKQHRITDNFQKNCINDDDYDNNLKDNSKKINNSFKNSINSSIINNNNNTLSEKGINTDGKNRKNDYANGNPYQIYSKKNYHYSNGYTSTASGGASTTQMKNTYQNNNGRSNKSHYNPPDYNKTKKPTYQIKSSGAG